MLSGFVVYARAATQGKCLNEFRTLRTKPVESPGAHVRICICMSVCVFHTPSAPDYVWICVTRVAQRVLCVSPTSFLLKPQSSPLGKGLVAWRVHGIPLVRRVARLCEQSPEHRFGPGHLTTGRKGGLFLQIPKSPPRFLRVSGREVSCTQLDMWRRTRKKKLACMLRLTHARKVPRVKFVHRTGTFAPRPTSNALLSCTSVWVAAVPTSARAVRPGQCTLELRCT